MRARAGRARRLGDDVNTDYVIASSRKKESIDPDVLRAWLLESVDPAFAGSVRAGDVLVAGERFGGGSAMEIAVTVVQAAGIQAVVARSFSRTWFRNSINNGLLPIECDTSGIEEGDRLTLDWHGDRPTVRVERTGETLVGAALPGFVRAMLDAGGLVSWVKRHGTLIEGTPA